MTNHLFMTYAQSRIMATIFMLFIGVFLHCAWAAQKKVHPNDTTGFHILNHAEVLTHPGFKFTGEFIGELKKADGTTDKISASVGSLGGRFSHAYSPWWFAWQ